MLPDALENATDVFAFDEQQGVTLASPVLTDIQTPGTYDQLGDLTVTAIPAGTVVDSHLVHSDRPGSSPGTGTILRTFSITFPTDIVGVIARPGRLNDSDVLGAPGTLYGGSSRGLSFGTDAGADVVILPDQRTVQGVWHTTSGTDEMRVLTAHNAPPTANAGGPYAGSEGSPIPLSGAASDPDGDPLSTTWSIATTGDPGVSCSLAGAATLAPTVTCNDDALVTATLSVDDGTNPAVTATAQLTVGNVAPTLGALTVPAGPVALGASAAVQASFADVGTNDSHTSTITWGDTTSSSATVSETSGSGTASGSHVYALPGVYTVTLTTTDKDLGTVTTTGQITVNGPPAADSGGPYHGTEGLPTTLVGTATDPENDPLTFGWTFTPGALDPGASCVDVGSTTLAPSLTCTDDAVVGASLSASDGVNPPTVSSTTVTVDNAAPVLGALAGTAGPIATGAPVSVLAPFTDGGVNDTHTATVDWGDLTNSPASISESGGTGALSAGHTYGTPGIYTITVTLTDDDLGVDTQTTQVIVNSPPTVDAGGPYVGLEGAGLSLTGTAADPDGDGLAVSWAFSVSGDPGVVCLPSGTGTLTPTLTCNDDAMITATLTVSDGVNAPVSSVTTIAVGQRGPGDLAGRRIRESCPRGQHGLGRSDLLGRGPGRHPHRDDRLG